MKIYLRLALFFFPLVHSHFALAHSLENCSTHMLKRTHSLLVAECIYLKAKNTNFDDSFFSVFCLQTLFFSTLVVLSSNSIVVASRGFIFRYFFRSTDTHM